MSTKLSLTRRQFVKAAIFGVAAGTLAACSAAAPTKAPEKAPATTAPEAAKPTEAPSTAAKSISGKSGKLWGLKYDPHVDAYKRLAAMFQTQTGASLNVEPQDWPIEVKVITALSAGTPPDAVCIMGKVLTPLHLQKALMPLTDVVYKAGGIDPKTDFVGDAIGAYTWNGELWGVPVEVNGVGSMVNVPVDDVKELKLDANYPPTNGKGYFDSYDDLYTLAKALTKKDGDKVTRWGLSSQGWDSTSFLGIMRSMGVDWWDLNSKKFNVDSESGIEAMKLLVENPVKMGIETQLDDAGINKALQGQVAIVRGNGTPTVQGKDLGYHYELTGAPRVKAGEDPLFIGEAGWGFASVKTAPNPDIAVAFLQMLASVEGQKEYSKIYGGIISCRKQLQGVFDYFKDPSPESPNVKAAKVAQQYLLPRTIFYGEQFGYASDVDAAIAAECADVRGGKKTAAEGAKGIQDRLLKQYQQFQDDAKKVGA